MRGRDRDNVNNCRKYHTWISDLIRETKELQISLCHVKKRSIIVVKKFSLLLFIKNAVNLVQIF